MRFPPVLKSLGISKDCYQHTSRFEEFTELDSEDESSFNTVHVYRRKF